MGVNYYPKAKIPCPKCGRKNVANGKIEDIMFYKCNCGRIIINQLIGIETIKLNKSLNTK